MIDHPAKAKNTIADIIPFPDIVAGDKFMFFLEERSKERGDIPISEVREKRGIENL